MSEHYVFALRTYLKALRINFKNSTEMAEMEYEVNAGKVSSLIDH